MRESAMVPRLVLAGAAEFSFPWEPREGSQTPPFLLKWKDLCFLTSQESTDSKLRDSHEVT